jgi:SAM-dependent methyltransferase
MKTEQRTPERLRRHYEVEKALADRLRKTTSREERAKMYESMYDTLFAAVPDHPRLTRAHDPAYVARVNRARIAIVGPYLHPGTRALDVGAGDCTFSFELARRVKQVVAVEIAAGSTVTDNAPRNFELILYDGFHLPVAPGSIDLAFSDQVIEHLHLDDVEWHFKMIADVLAPGGYYVFRTPHGFTGPHDVSEHFTTGAPEGFHMKEWTYGEIVSVLQRAGYRKLTAVWCGKGIAFRVPIGLMKLKEALLRPLPRGLRRKVSVYPFPSLTIAARKA